MNPSESQYRSDFQSYYHQNPIIHTQNSISYADSDQASSALLLPQYPKYSDQTSNGYYPQTYLDQADEIDISRLSPNTISKVGAILDGADVGFFDNSNAVNTHSAHWPSGNDCAPLVPNSRDVKDTYKPRMYRKGIENVQMKTEVKKTSDMDQFLANKLVFHELFYMHKHLIS